jgi:hypothetical protein
MVVLSCVLLDVVIAQLVIVLVACKLTSLYQACASYVLLTVYLVTLQPRLTALPVSMGPFSPILPVCLALPNVSPAISPKHNASNVLLLSTFPMPLVSPVHRTVSLAILPSVLLVILVLYWVKLVLAEGVC